MTIELKGIGKVTCTEDAMNSLSLILHAASIRYEEMGLIKSSADAFENSNIIYKTLDKKGYYSK